MAKSLTDIAYDYIAKSSAAVPFAELWAHVCKESELDEKAAEAKVGQFYTNLTLDGRIVVLRNNLVDLKSRHKYEEYHIDMKAAYDDAETASDDSETLEEEKRLSGELGVEDTNEYEPDSEEEDKESYR